MRIGSTAFGIESYSYNIWFNFIHQFVYRNNISVYLRFFRKNISLVKSKSERMDSRRFYSEVSPQEFNLPFPEHPFQHLNIGWIFGSRILGNQVIFKILCTKP